MTNKFEQAEEAFNSIFERFPSRNLEHYKREAEKIREALRMAQNSDFEHLHQHSKLAAGNYDYQCGFLDCLELVKGQTTPPRDDGWRSIKTFDGKEGLYLVREETPYPDEEIFIGDYSNGGWSIHIDGQKLNPTHWRPLPTPPSEEE